MHAMRVFTSSVALRLLAAAVAWAAAAASAPAPAPDAASQEANFDIACMLLGSVAFIMMIFYLLNFPDEDIRDYSWNVVSASICTFTGVHIGTAWNDLLGFFVLGPDAPVMKTIQVQLCAMLGWYVLLQFVLALVSGAVGPKPTSIRNMVLNMKCWAALLGITNGASNMGLWGIVQHQLGSTVALAAVAVPIAWVSLWLLFKAGDMVRDRVNAADDGVEDLYEQIYEQFAMQTENGAACMCMSHLVVQAMRFQITGVLPLPGGQVPPGMAPTMRHAGHLLAASCVFALLIVVIDLSFPKRLGRIKLWAKTISGNCVAFCLLYAVDWSILGLVGVGPIGSMMLALAVTLVGFIIIFILDVIIDMECTGERVDAQVKAMIGPLSLLIGFSWKQAFVAAVRALNSRLHIVQLPIQTMFLAAGIGVVVVPAWKMYILPCVPSMLAEVAKHEKAEKENSEGAPVSRQKTMLIEIGSTMTAPLLGNDAQKAATEVDTSSPLIAELIQHNTDLKVRAAELEKRNRDLEVSLSTITSELGELKGLAERLAV